MHSMQQGDSKNLMLWFKEIVSENEIYKLRWCDDANSAKKSGTVLKMIR